MRCTSAGAVAGLALFRIGGVGIDLPNPFGHGLLGPDHGFDGSNLFDGFGLHVFDIPSALADGGSGHRAHTSHAAATTVTPPSGHAAGADGCAFGNHQKNGQSATAPGCKVASAAGAATTVTPASRVAGAETAAV